MIYLYVLEGCPFSIAAIELTEELNLPYKKIVVKSKSKTKYKKKHRMDTFPHIFFKNRKGKMIKIGGYEEYKSIIGLCLRV